MSVICAPYKMSVGVVMKKPQVFTYCQYLSRSICTVWWPRTAIRNFLDNSRKFNFCDRLILKLLNIFFYKENIKDLLFIFQTQVIFKTLEFV